MITIILSSELFQGFSVQFPDELAKLNFQEQVSIVNAQIKQDLMDFFMQRNLYNLKERADAMVIHLHDVLVPNTTTYACDHPHNY